MVAYMIRKCSPSTDSFSFFLSLLRFLKEKSDIILNISINFRNYVGDAGKS